MAVIDAELRTWLDQSLGPRVREMAHDADVPLPAAAVLAAAGTVDRAEPEDRLVEVTQYLRNLGYIDADRAQRLVEEGPDQPDLATGYRAFAREARDWLARDIGRRPGKDLLRAVDHAARQDLADGPVQLDALLVEALRQLTSLDGEFEIGRMVTTADNGVLVRVAQFRLGAYGFFDDPINGIYDETLGTRVTECLNVTQLFLFGKIEANRKRMLDRFGDVMALMKACRLHPKLSGTPIVLRRQGVDFGRIHEATAKSRSSDSVFLDAYELKGNDFPVWHDADGKKKSLSTTERSFALHLVQNVLWVNGYYDGRVEGMFLKRSTQALADAIGAHEAAREGVVYGIRTDFVGLWLSRLDDMLSAKPAKLTEREADLRAVVERPEERRSLLGRLFDGIKEIFKTAVKAGRSVMVGAAKLLEEAADVLGGVGALIGRGVKAVTTFVEGLIDKVRNLAVLVYRGLREALLALNRALDPIRHFLFGKPIVSRREGGEAFAASRFQVDRDGVQCVLPTATAAEIADHFDLCGRLSRIFAASIRLAVVVARIAIAGVSGPPGWIMAAVSFTSVVTDLVPLAKRAD